MTTDRWQGYPMGMGTAGASTRPFASLAAAASGSVICVQDVTKNRHGRPLGLGGNTG